MNQIKRMEEGQEKMQFQLKILMARLEKDGESEDLSLSVQKTLDNIEYNQQALKNLKEEQKYFQDDIDDLLTLLNDIEQKTPLTEQEVKGLEGQRDLIERFFKYAQEDLEQLLPSQMELPIDIQVENQKETIATLELLINEIEIDLIKDNDLKQRFEMFKKQQEEQKAMDTYIVDEIINLEEEMHTLIKQIDSKKDQIQKMEDKKEDDKPLNQIRQILIDLEKKRINIQILQKNQEESKKRIAKQEEFFEKRQQAQPLTGSSVEELMLKKKLFNWRLINAREDLAKLQARQGSLSRETANSGLDHIPDFVLDGVDTDDSCGLSDHDLDTDDSSGSSDDDLDTDDTFSLDLKAALCLSLE